jgi:archaellum component FlaC
MRRYLWIPLLVVAVVLAVVAVRLDRNLDQSRQQYTTLRADEEATRNRYGLAIEEIAAIQDSLDAIVVGDDGTRRLSQQLDAETSLTRERSDETMDRIAVIRAGVERAKARIEELESRLQTSDVKVAGLEKLVKNLRASVEERELAITQLTARVEELQVQVAGLTSQVREGAQLIEAQAVTIETQTAVIEERRREQGTVYYTIGTKKELKEAGLVVSKGGVLGLGRTLKLSGEFDAAHFSTLDTDEVTVIHIAAKKARVLSDQPVTSYALVPVGEEFDLHILDAQAFRAVKHVVIMTS